jgi:hypothetical protein
VKRPDAPPLHSLSEAEFERLDRLGDLLIPGSEERPSVSEADRRRIWLSRALSVRPDLVDHLRRALRVAGSSDSLTTIENRLKEDPDGLEALTTVVAARYYMNPEIKALIGYPGQGGREGATPRETWEQAVDLLERVVDRGPTYRPTPNSLPGA